MILSVVVTVCHLAAPAPAPHASLGIRPDPRALVSAQDLQLCHEEIIFEGDGSMQACLVALPAAADWKLKSEYADDGWSISRIRCIPGHYEKRNAI